MVGKKKINLRRRKVIKRIAQKLLDKYRLKRFSFEYKNITSEGRCYPYRELIQLNGNMVDNGSLQNTIYTIKHEIVHALWPELKHGKYFWQKIKTIKLKNEHNTEYRSI